MKITKHLIISGRVQGVTYRAWMVGQAEKYNVHGWVKNRFNGTVEALLHGEEDNINQLIKDAYEGPMMADVSEIISSDTRYEGRALFETHATE